MLSLKEGVRPGGLRPETLLMITVVHSVFQSHGKDAVITSLTEGSHSRGSKHYSGFAADWRTRHLSEQIADRIAIGVKNALPTDYDVVLESTHLHVEYDPKTGVNK